MKAILICPNQAHGLTVLADKRPIAALPILGDAFVCHWMHWLAAQKFSEVRVITPDPVATVQELTGDGSRWGLKIEVFHEIRDLQPDEARKRYRPSYEEDWPPEPLDVIEASHLPGLPGHPLFSSYQEWFRSFSAWLPVIAKTKRIGMRELAPGVWAGRRTKIARTARLIGPCWIGDHVQIGRNCVIGPNSFLECQVVIDQDSSIAESWIGPETFLGSLVELKESLAWGNLLVNWKTGSHTLVPDAFLLASLTDDESEESRPAVRPLVPAPALARRIEGVISLAQKMQS